MGRKTVHSSSSKASVSNQGKTGDVTKGPKRQHRKPPTPAVSNVVKKRPVQSRPGFTLYSASSRVDSNQNMGSTGSTGSSSKAVVKHGGKAEQTTGDSEIVSQVQLQEERAKSAQASSLHIPTADHDDSLSRGENDDIVVSTPFNKRLVSSTPDPEKLRESEPEEYLTSTAGNALATDLASDTSCSQPLDDTPQLIPERDVMIKVPSVLPSDARSLISIVKSLDAKHRLQPELSHPPELTGQRSNAGITEKPDNSGHVKPLQLSDQVKSVPPWKQRHQKWRQELEQYRRDHTVNQSISESGSDKILNSQALQIAYPSSTPLVTKAEWVSDKKPSHGSKRTAIKSPASINNLWEQNSPQTSPLIQGNGQLASVTNSAGAVNPSTEHSLPVMTTQREDFSSCGINKVLPTSLPNNASSLQGLQNSLPEVDTCKDYDLFKSEIMYSKSHAAPRAFSDNIEVQNGTEGSTLQLVNLHASTHPVQHQSVIATSTFTHTTAVSSLGNSFKVHEAATESVLARAVKLSPKGAFTQPGAVDTKLSSVKTGSKLLEKIDLKDRAQAGLQGEEMSDLVQVVGLTKEREPVVVPTAVELDSDDKYDVEKVSNTDNALIAKNSALTRDQDNKSENSESINNTSYLSDMINLLKKDVFTAGKKMSIDDDDSKSESSEIGADQTDEKQKKQEMEISGSSDKNLKEIMSQYLPTEKSVQEEPDNPNEETKVEIKIRNEPLDVNNSSLTKMGDIDSNQNYHSDDSGYDVPRRTRRSHNLYYLESMADSTLKNIACRLAFKATALRDVELRDLIDDMIFYTDAALGHENARSQSSHLFLQEENAKLKKRLHNVNRQLDAKERQEKMAAANAYSTSNNELLHLERQMVYLRQEKDKVDTQLTSLLEEKSRWLVTQQDLVKTISLKDHEILKLEEKHQQERIKLHQSLDQATQNSQGVHYKLSVADREISNMEQRLKCRDLDIADLREKLRQAELNLADCKQQATQKDQEIVRLKDMVDTLKIGVDHVLQMFESGSHNLTATEQQRQGMDSLYRMAHPERFGASTGPESREPVPSAQEYRLRGRPEVGVQGSAFLSPATLAAADASVQTSAHLGQSLPIRPEPCYPDQYRAERADSQQNLSWMQRRLLRESREQGAAYPERQRGRAGNQLTASTLARHNQRLSPIDRRLWRSMHESPVEVAAEPYYSDSEVELNQRESRRYVRKSPKSILKRKQAKRGEAGQRYWQQPVSSTGKFYEDIDNSERRKRDSSGQRKRSRVRSKSESDKYTDLRESYRDLPRTLGNRRPRVRSGTPRERRAISPEDSDYEDDSRFSVSDYFMKYSEMPRLPKSPRQKERNKRQQEVVRDRAQRGSQSTKYSSLYSVPISSDNGTWGNKTPGKSSKTPTPKSLPQDDDLVEMDIESSSISSSELDFSRIESSRQENAVGKRKGPWNTARSFSPSTLRKTQQSKKRERRSRSLEDPPKETRYTDDEESLVSPEQTTQFRILEPDQSTSRQNGQNLGKNNVAQKQISVSSSSDPGQGPISFSRRAPSQQDQRYLNTGQSNAEKSRDHSSQINNRGLNFPLQSSPMHLSEITLSHRAAKGGDLTQRDFFQGTELSSSMSSIDDDNNALVESKNNNRMKSLNEDLFSTGIASLDLKIANLQKKIDRAKAIFS
ncbi:hypothetical protein PoB_006939500 [Plakobranchus ocellatus]|uniref:Uncharacterized protein n=1 Tax=Plakobranchus ocellatus TaxID=259542 RepID=A0AAV4DFX2_9GAST|nr:hypothetical protein PoB_006939500 [Plakobranchus ocellatus]